MSAEKPISFSVRKGQSPGKLSRDEFRARYLAHFVDPLFRQEDEALARIEEVAWQAYHAGRKAPLTRRAGPGYADPDYELSVDWLAARDKLIAAQARWRDPQSPSRVLVITASPRNDGTCPGEISKTFRLSAIAGDMLAADGFNVDHLDLSLLTSEYGRHIHPCKGCVSTAMPLCHWPCSCYPNHSVGQTHDWMAEIYERWTLAHGVLIVIPVHWYQAPTVFKAMMDRLVCADGGNPDPTSTGGKDAVRAKQLELAGWDYPKHLAGRAYGVIAHGDVAGVESLRRNLCDWLDWMGLVDAGTVARLDRYVGYFEPYATSHEALDADLALHAETRNAARALGMAVGEVRAGRLRPTSTVLRQPRPK